MTVERHLVLVQTHGFQDVRDFEEIARRIRDLAPDIDVFIANNEIRSSVTRRRAARMPTLVVSPGKLIDFRPLRGKVYAGVAIPKLEQLARFQAAGIPVRIYILDCTGRFCHKEGRRTAMSDTHYDLNNPAFTDEDAARKWLEASRWPDGPVCPHCGQLDSVSEFKGKSMGPGWYHCNECREKFTVRVGTLYERSHIPLHKWLLATHLLTSSKKGMSAHQMHRMLGITYKSAWFMAHRIRAALEGTNTAPMGGSGSMVQADKTYYGNTSKRAKHYKKGHSHKSGVVALVDPANGQARAFAVQKATADTVRHILRTNVDRASTIVTDESSLYTKVGREYDVHATVNHAAREYVTPAGFTTNNVENFFGVFKKGMVGVYHFCGEQHLQRYLDEFAFRYSNRSGLGVSDQQRMALAVKGIEGKRLTYRSPH